MAKEIKKINRFKNFRWGIALIVLIVLFIAQAYILPPKNVVGRSLLNFIPLPAVLVNADAVLISDFYNRIEIADKIGDVTGNDRATILQKLISNKIAELTLKNKKLQLTNSELDEGYAFMQKVTGKEQLGTDYGISEKEFKNDILKPDLIKTELQIYLAGNKKLNEQPYKKLEEAKKALADGVSFSDTAQKYSDDGGSSQIGGDMGFVSYNDIVPEIYNQLEGIKDKDGHVIVSRFGVHIIQVTDKDTKGPQGSVRYHVHQIYIKTADFDQWMDKQKDYFTVLKLVR
jgi:parvulin-like peptidyl-prolyl isomerase